MTGSLPPEGGPRLSAGFPRLAPAFCLILCAGCATTSFRTAGSDVAGPMAIAQEVTLTARNQRPQLGKIVDLDSSRVTFLPSPYWGVDSRTLDLDDITIIRVKIREGSGRAALSSFGVAFVVIGGLAAASSRYDQDYSAGLIVAGAGGLVAGILGAIIGSSHTTTYRFQRMGPERKRSVLHELMGH